MHARPNQRLKTSLNSTAILALDLALTQTESAFRSSVSPNQYMPYNKSIESIARGCHAARGTLLWFASLGARRASAQGARPSRPNPLAVLTVHRCVIRTR